MIGIRRTVAPPPPFLMCPGRIHMRARGLKPPTTRSAMESSLPFEEKGGSGRGKKREQKGEKKNPQRQSFEVKR